MLNHLRRRALPIGAFSLAVSLVAFGCTDAKKSEQSPEVGQPVAGSSLVAQEKSPRDDTLAEPERGGYDRKKPDRGAADLKRVPDPIVLESTGKTPTPREPTKVNKEPETQEYRTPQGLMVRLSVEHDPWADAVVSLKRGKPAPQKNKNPWNAVGKPAGHSCALGHGGELVLEFIDNVLVDGPGDDLVIFEAGKAVEPTHLWISENGTDWIDIGRAAGSKSTMDIGPFVKPGQRFRFVRLKDAKSGKSKGSDFPGADINAVGALNSLPVPGAPSRQEIESRWKK